jgi:sugar transferase (PEP-CTERM/EpsH1 system associated)
VRILYLTSRFPWPPDRGDRLTVVNMLRALSARHRVTLLSFVDGHEPPDAMAQVSPHCERVVTVPLSRARSWLQAWLGVGSTLPSQVSFYRSRRMTDVAHQLLREGRFDAVISHAIRMAPYVPDLAPPPVTILFQGDSVGLVLGGSIPYVRWWRRPGIAWERWRVDRFTAAATRRFSETWVLSPIDLEDMRRLGGVRLEYLPHGVDERLFALERAPHPEPRLMFLGNLGVPHNEDAAVFAAREIWPRVRPDLPSGRLLLVGADPSPAVRRLAALDGVEVTGRVQGLLPLWRSAHVLVAPLRFSTGIQNKLLEAMAAGVPVVTTRQAAEAIGARHGEHLLVADTADTLAAAVRQTLADPQAASGRAARARDHVAQHFSWDLAVRRLERLVDRGEGERSQTGDPV